MNLRPSNALRFVEDVAVDAAVVVAATPRVVAKGLFAFVHHAQAVAFERAAKVEAWRLRRAHALIARANEINSDKLGV